jgi:hypothetical protein
VTFEAVGTVVDLEGYVLIRVFRIVSRDGDTEHWATDDLAMDELTRLGMAERTWAIENYHRGLKQCNTLGWRSGRSYGLSAVSTPPGPVGPRPRRKSFEGRSQPTSPNHRTICHDCVTSQVKYMRLCNDDTGSVVYSPLALWSVLVVSARPRDCRSLSRSSASRAWIARYVRTRYTVSYFLL